MLTLRLLLLINTLSLIGCSMSGERHAIQPFSTDGCSMFPDHSLISDQDWCHCCVVHDIAYWRGGTSAERELADRRLRDCVANTTNNHLLAELMYAGVRTGGGAYYFTDYRWGYGWKYGRGYQALSASEQAMVATEQATYLSRNPFLLCNKPQRDVNAATVTATKRQPASN